jgi:hypothetical protein
VVGSGPNILAAAAAPHAPGRVFDPDRNSAGSGANVVEYMLLLGERLCRFRAASTAAHISGAAPLLVTGLRLNCCFMIFAAGWNAADRHGRHLAALESEHGPHSLFDSAVVLLH